MNRIHKKRLYTVTGFAIAISVGVGLILYSLQQNINVFLTPQQITSKIQQMPFRLGGLVKPGTIKRDKDSLAVEFVVTDNKRDIKVTFNGILPDLFREGKGVIAAGHLNTQGIFMAEQVLAKHDENYMPKNVYEAMRKAT